MEHLRHNLRVLERVAGESAVWAVLKADAYGHGSKAVARTLERAGVAGICVALLEEGVELREAGIRIPILVMGGHYGRAWEELLHYRLTPVLHASSQLKELAHELRFAELNDLGVHVKVDTGMSRLGVMPPEMLEFARAAAEHPEIRILGLMTHLACADLGDEESVNHQLDLFDNSLRTLNENGIFPSLRHVASSAALLSSPRTRLDVVRPGIAIYGVEPAHGLCSDLRPVMRVRTDLVALRELPPGQAVGYGATWTAKRASRIATIPIGYADGLHRALSNRGRVLVRGGSAPIVGVVSMDMTMVDVTDIPGASIGDECVVLGSQRGPLGQATITATEIAERIGSIPWEVLTSISRRVPRFYREP
jgi:alanine racemase